MVCSCFKPKVFLKNMFKYFWKEKVFPLRLLCGQSGLRFMFDIKKTHKERQKYQCMTLTYICHAVRAIDICLGGFVVALVIHMHPTTTFCVVHYSFWALSSDTWRALSRLFVSHAQIDINNVSCTTHVLHTLQSNQSTALTRNILYILLSVNVS